MFEQLSRCRLGAASYLLIALAFHPPAYANPPEEPAPPQATVTLPKVVVTAPAMLPDLKYWRYARIPRFEVLSDLPDKDTWQLLRDFQVFQSLLNIVWRGAQPPLTESVPLILCASDRQFDAFRPNAAPYDPSFEGGATSLFLHIEKRSALILDAEATTRTVRGQVGPVAVEPVQQLEREYVKYLFNRKIHDTPAWLEEGTAQMLTRLWFDGRKLLVGKLDTSDLYFTTYSRRGAASSQPGLQLAQNGNTGSDLLAPGPGVVDILHGTTEGDFKNFLQHRQLMPFGQFFAAEHGSKTAENAVASLWARQAEAFVHLCTYGADTRYYAAFAKFRSRLGKEPPSEALFVDCFHMNYKQMRRVLDDYISRTHYKFITYTLKAVAVPEPAPAALREATESEAACLTSEAWLLGGHETEARAALLAPYNRGARDSRLLAALGVAKVAAKPASNP